MYLIAVFSVIVVFFLTVILSGSISLAWFIDLPSFLLLVVIVVPILIGSGMMKDFVGAFKIGMSKKNNFTLVQMKNAVCAVSLVIKSLVAAAGFIAIIAFTIILGSLSDLQKLGPNLSVALLIFGYSLFFVLILLPLKARIEKLINIKLGTE